MKSSPISITPAAAKAGSDAFGLPHWGTAFAIHLFSCTPWLMRARLDGKDG